jgi:SagB-type dehydrogenase family enzyme
MNKELWIKSFLFASLCIGGTGLAPRQDGSKSNPKMSTSVQHVINLPPPVYRSNTSIEEALLKRRSVRAYKNEPMDIKDIAQLLWAAQGITSAEGHRTTPSAGALYPLEIYLVSGDINNLPAGVYHYTPLDHSLTLIEAGDKRKLLAASALMQGSINRSAGVIVISGVYARTTIKYFERGKKYVHMEAGHCSQNIYLQAVSLNIGTVVMGAFTDTLVKKVLKLPREAEPLYLMPIGKI